MSESAHSDSEQRFGVRVREAFYPLFIPSRVGMVILWFIILLYFVTFAGLGLRRHLALQTSAYDLGMMDQAVWNILHGHPFRETVDVETHTLLAEHLQLILLLFLSFT